MEDNTVKILASTFFMRTKALLLFEVESSNVFMTSAMKDVLHMHHIYRLCRFSVLIQKVLFLDFTIFFVLML